MFILYVYFERGSSQSLTRGHSSSLATVPAISPTCPASKTTNSLSWLPTRSIVASAWATGQIKSLLPATFNRGALDVREVYPAPAKFYLSLRKLILLVEVPDPLLESLAREGCPVIHPLTHR